MADPIVYIPSYTLENLAVLEQAIASGTRSVYYGDKRVDYRSLDEMQRIRNVMLDALNIGNSKNTTSLGMFGDGFGCGYGPGFEGDGGRYF